MNNYAKEGKNVFRSVCLMKCRAVCRAKKDSWFHGVKRVGRRTDGELDTVLVVTVRT